MKKVISALLLVALLLSLSVPAYAVEQEMATERNVFEILNSVTSGVTTHRSGGSIVYTVTNPQVIRQLSDAPVLPNTIELTYIPSNNIEQASDATPRLFESYEVRNKVDQGDGWYSSSSHQIYEFYVDGPDTFVIDETKKYSASTTCGVSAAMDVIEASVGFTIGEEHELHIQSNTPVASGQRLHVEIFRTHHRVNFDLYQKPVGGSWSKYGSYYALKPNGVFIKKEFWDM